ncbi:DGQHR domain-containing protein [Chryseobacterium sp. PBS4-4]|uniref:DGQHR domain-containing protein n=1 Tax=Chryseobacterium edaphi TaxID=2976532 RepID=A0ABT2W129_9FLAO|nr:DGQHR domain-containing protein [Chryseobacterium edaphi]MCU7615891.1 DGQHR domain-containing protein [Chryseobacterium edaphi]
MAKKTKPKKKTSKKYSPEELAQRREQSNQEKEIRDIMKNIGFQRLPYIDGKEFEFDGRISEIDDIFILENVILITEYTIGTPGTHLLKKKIFYDKIFEDKKKFIEFLLSEEKLKSFKDYYEKNISSKYSKNELQLRIVYCSKKIISAEHKRLVDNIVFFDYHIVQYFKSLTKTIKRSSKYEFMDFMHVPFDKFGINVKNSSSTTTHTFTGNILPEEKSKFEEGYKIVSFYIDADSLLRRSYVLRQNGWKDIENVGHYQRMLENSKINSMRKYLADQKRVFINNIIVTIQTDKIQLLDKDGNTLPIKDNGDIGDGIYEVSPTQIKIEDSCNIIGLIDGQHRTYAYHEGDDVYEKKIAELRNVQNLLVTGILFPKRENEKKKLDFEARLFLEINNNQKTVPSHVVQEIQVMTDPFSNIAIGKKILLKLNQSGPLSNLIEQYWYEKGKLKTASVVSYGLRPLIKIEDIKSKDSLFHLWNDESKNKLKLKNTDDFDLLNSYIEFSAEKIRDLLIAFKSNLDTKKWATYSPSLPDGLLSVSFINGILNVLRLLIENNKVSDIMTYKKKLEEINNFNFKQFKSSQYRKLGEKIYKDYFN